MRITASYKSLLSRCEYSDNKYMKIAFDVDDSIWKIDREHKRQVPDYDLIQVLRWFYNNGDEVFVWSAGGQGYAQDIVDKLGLTEMVTCIPKISRAKLLEKRYEGMDIAFDDCETNLAKVDVLVKRNNNE